MLSTVLNGMIRFALRNRMLVAAGATYVLLYGCWQIAQLPIDVFPDLNRPRVVVMTEAPGLAPEEVETLITFPLETTLNGATGVQAVRSSSGVGISVIYVEFDWGTDIYVDRQIVAERIALASEQLPADVKPQLAPISSIMGQIIIAGMYSRPTPETKVGEIPGDWSAMLNAEQLPPSLSTAFGEVVGALSDQARVEVDRRDRQWLLADPETDRWWTLITRNDRLGVYRRTSPMELRTLADWVVRQQLLTIAGVSQVFTMGGQHKQFQVLVNPEQLLKFGLAMHDVERAVAESNENATGGYLDDQGPNELLVRALGRIQSIRDLEQIVVAYRDGRSILLDQVARVVEGPQVKRGDASALVRQDDGSFSGGRAVVLTINKQPGEDTRRVTDTVTEMLTVLQQRMPPDVAIEPALYQQKLFIDLAIENVIEALRDGGILVVVILFLFLLNFRTTFITLTAIPLSIVVTGLVFKVFGLSINTMTLGGLAVAIGELVDDAIVDVENIFRRLRENRLRENPRPALLVVFQASVEIRNSIVFGTIIVVLVFIPLFALEGMEGRLFTPLGIAYIVSILSSLVVSLTVTPVLSYWLLPQMRMAHGAKDGLLLRTLKWLAAGAIRTSLTFAWPILLVALAVVLVSGAVLGQMESDFLPPFDEGAVQINVLLPAGTSLAKSNEVARIAERRLEEIDDIESLVRKTGRAEQDEHAEGVNVSEFVATVDPASTRAREDIL